MTHTAIFLRSVPAGLLAVLLLLAVPSPPAGASDAHTWNDRVKESDRLLVAGEYGNALALTSGLVEEVGGSLLPGEGHDRFLGSVLALHALALAGTGEEDEAEWTWYLAQSLKRDLRSMDLERYGAAGTVLDPHRFDPEAERCRAGEAPPSVDGRRPVALSEDVVPPRRLEVRQPQYTPAARAAGLEGKVITEVVVTRDGRLEQPCVLLADAPALAYMTVRTMRDWKFEPGRFEGEPVDVVWVTTVDFTLDPDRRPGRRPR